MFARLLLLACLAAPTTASEEAADLALVHAAATALVGFDGPAPNVGCVALHCGGPAAKCTVNSGCRSAIKCTAGCGASNQTCIFQCTSDFENDVYDNLIRCMFTEHDCMQMPKGQTFDPWGPCKSVEQAKTLTTYLGKPLTSQVAKDLLRRSGKDKGYWLVAQGLSKAYDCFDCQNVWFNAMDQDSSVLSYVPIYKVHRSDGESRWNKAFYNASSIYPEAGRLRLHAQDYGGLVHDEDWRILGIDERTPNSPEWIAMYYCGNAVGVKQAYEGSCLITLDGTTPADTAELKKISAAWAAAGVDPQCYPNNSAESCKGHPSPFDSAHVVV